MRVTGLFLVLSLGVLAAPATSYAEKVRTNAKAKVYNRPGEQGKIIVRVKEGQAMTVLAKEGRWVKVRVSGRTGFIPRSYLDMGNDDEEFARNTRRRPFVDGRSTKRSFGGSAPDDRIGADATEDRGEGDSEGDEPSEDDGEDEKPEKKPKKPEKPEKASSGEEEEEEEIEGSDEEEPATEEEEEVKDDRKKARVDEKTVAYSDPDKKSDKSFTATPKDVLFVESTKGKWTEVSVEEGDIGWILTSKLEVDGDDDDGGSEGGGGSKKRMIDTRARLGFRLVSQRLTSAGGGTAWPDNYKIGSSAAALSLGGSLLFPYKKDFLVGGGIDYDMAYAIPGIAFDPDGQAGNMPGGTTSFVMHNLRVRGIGGYDFRKKNGLKVLAKLGLHYESFMVANNTDLVKNTARLPSEVIKGPSLGLGLAIPRLTSKIGLAVNLDAVLVGGSVTQTKNLEDGEDPTVKRYTVGAIVNYEYGKGFDLNFGYDLNYAKVTFGAPIGTSMRMHTGTGVSRTDLNHTVSAGVSKAF